MILRVEAILPAYAGKLLSSSSFEKSGDFSIACGNRMNSVSSASAELDLVWLYGCGTSSRIRSRLLCGFGFSRIGFSAFRMLINVHLKRFLIADSVYRLSLYYQRYILWKKTKKA